MSDLIDRRALIGPQEFSLDHMMDVIKKIEIETLAKKKGGREKVEHNYTPDQEENRRGKKKDGLSERKKCVEESILAM